MDFYGRLDTLTGRQREASQAQARPARIRYHVDATGIGESRAKIGFATMMLEEPTFSWGTVCRTPIPQGAMPLFSSCVLEWIQNERGLYVGSRVGLLIEGGPAGMRVTFTLTFEGVALRAMNRAMQ